MLPRDRRTAESVDPETVGDRPGAYTTEIESPLCLRLAALKNPGHAFRYPPLGVNRYK